MKLYRQKIEDRELKYMIIGCLESYKYRHNVQEKALEIVKELRESEDGIIFFRFDDFDSENGLNEIDFKEWTEAFEYVAEVFPNSDKEVTVKRVSQHVRVWED